LAFIDHDLDPDPDLVLDLDLELDPDLVLDADLDRKAIFKAGAPRSKLNI